MYEFEEEDRQEPEAAQRSLRQWPQKLVRVIGIVLLLIGLWSSVHVLLEALRLYRDPVKIEVLAAAIERGSNLDRNLHARGGETSTNVDSGLTTPLATQASANNIRLTYFVAWLVALLILLLVAMIAFSCIRTGSELVLQDKQMKNYLRVLAKELVRQNKSQK